jgi:putative membrane protein
MKKLTLALAIVISAGAVKAQTERDKEFAQEAVQIGLLEVKLGELAKTKGVTSAAKDLGGDMVTEHTKANNELKTLVASKNIPLPTSLSEEGQKEYDKLSKKEGKDFDKAYTHCMVKGHKKAICKFKKEAKKGDDAELKSWASNTIPALEHHKEMSKDACKAVHKS